MLIKAAKYLYGALSGYEILNSASTSIDPEFSTQTLVNQPPVAPAGVC
jgi:hypothetical protein